MLLGNNISSRTFKIFIGVLFFSLWIECRGPNTSRKVSYSESQHLILTHALVPAGPIPTAFDPNGVYPYISYSETANRPEPVKYRFITLENDSIASYNSSEKRLFGYLLNKQDEPTAICLDLKNHRIDSVNQSWQLCGSGPEDCDPI